VISNLLCIHWQLHYLNKQVEELKFENKVSGEKALAEIVTLNEQKKVLVKEVKQCRKKIESSTEMLSTLSTDKESQALQLLEAESRFQDMSKKSKEQDLSHAQSILALQDMYEGKLVVLYRNIFYCD